MTHYVCAGGCGEISDSPEGVCSTPNCPMRGHQLKACHCEDSQHKEVIKVKDQMDKNK